MRGADQLALELREHGEHQTPVRCHCVGPRAGEGWKPGFLLLGDRRERVQQVACRARQPVDSRK